MSIDSYIILRICAEVMTFHEVDQISKEPTQGRQHTKENQLQQRITRMFVRHANTRMYLQPISS